MNTPVPGVKAPEPEVSAQVPPASAPESNVLRSKVVPVVLQSEAVLSGPAIGIGLTVIVITAVSLSHGGRGTAT